MSYFQNWWAQKDSTSITGDQGSNTVRAESKSIFMNTFCPFGKINVFFYVTMLNWSFLLLKMTEMKNVKQKYPFAMDSYGYLKF